MYRLLWILNLCCGLSTLLWWISYPWLGAHYEARSHLLRLETLQGIATTLTSLAPEQATKKEPQLLLYRSLFAQLAPEEQRWILEKTQEQHKRLSLSLAVKKEEFVHLLAYYSPWFISWALLTSIASIAGLLSHKSARPLTLIAAICFINYLHHMRPTSTKPPSILPQEDQLGFHLKKGSLADQRKALETAWNRYLTNHWSGSTQSLDHGNYYFQLALIHEKLRGNP